MTYQFARIDLEKNTDQATVNWAYLQNPNIAELRDIYRTYCIYKHFASVIPLFDSQFTDPDTDVLGYYNNDSLVAFSLIKRYDDNTVEIKTKKDSTDTGQSGGKSKVAQMAKSATSRRQG